MWPFKKKGDAVSFLAAGIGETRTLLEQHGFSRDTETQGVSHSQFAAVTFRRGDLEIGLIVRGADKLGCPNYSIGHGYAGHDDLFAALGRAGEARLVPAEFPAYEASDGGDAFVALAADLREVILPVLVSAEAELRDAITRAHNENQQRMFGKSP